MSNTNNSGNLFANLGTTPASDAAPADENKKVEPDFLDQEADETEAEPSELDLLKERAKFMGITFPNNIGVDALKAKIAAKLEGDGEHSKDDNESVKAAEAAPGYEPDFSAPPSVQRDIPRDEPKEELPVPSATRQPTNLRQYLMLENMRLVRVRITNLDPNDKDLHGQIYSVSNQYIGTVSKFIPFGEQSENGYHIEYCLYKLLKAQKFLQIRTIGKGDKARQESTYVRKFALEVLPPLTDKEIDTLRASQLGRNAIGDD